MCRGLSAGFLAALGTGHRGAGGFPLSGSGVAGPLGRAEPGGLSRAAQQIANVFIEGLRVPPTE